MEPSGRAPKIGGPCRGDYRGELEGPVVRMVLIHSLSYISLGHLIYFFGGGLGL